MVEADVDDGNQNVFVQGNQIAVLPDGTLVNVFAILFKGSGIQPPQANQVFMAAPARPTAARAGARSRGSRRSARRS